VFSKPVGVSAFHARVNFGGVVSARRFAEDGCECRAGVFHVEVEVARQKGLLAEQGAAEIALADDVNAGAGFDVLREQLSEDDLLSKEFGTDNDGRLRRLATGAGAANHAERKKEVHEAAHCCGQGSS